MRGKHFAQPPQGGIGILKGNSKPFHVIAIGLLVPILAAGHAFAHVVLTEPVAPPGARYVGQFKVGHGCSGSPTVTLRIEIPAGVSAVSPQDQPGWTVSTERDGAAVKAVVWKNGSLAADKAITFSIAMTLPAQEGPLLFPARQTCQSGEEYWSQAPLPAGKAKRPAPLLTVTADRHASAAVSVTDGWFRAMPASVPSGGYFKLRNGANRAVTLTDVQTPACGMTMIHKSGNGGMEHVMSLDLAAGETVVFAPGGYHLMCMNSTPLLKPGGLVPVTLIFADGSRATAEFQVRNALGK